MTVIKPHQAFGIDYAAPDTSHLLAKKKLCEALQAYLEETGLDAEIEADEWHRFSIGVARVRGEWLFRGTRLYSLGKMLKGKQFVEREDN